MNQYEPGSTDLVLNIEHAGTDFMPVGLPWSDPRSRPDLNLRLLVEAGFATYGPVVPDDLDTWRGLL